MSENEDMDTEIEQLRTKIQRVRHLHRDGGESQGFLPGRVYGTLPHACVTCGTFGELGVEWPCSTIQALDDDSHESTTRP